MSPAKRFQIIHRRDDQHFSIAPLHRPAPPQGWMALGRVLMSLVLEG